MDLTTPMHCCAWTIWIGIRGTGRKGKTETAETVNVKVTRFLRQGKKAFSALLEDVNCLESGNKTGKKGKLEVGVAKEKLLDKLLIWLFAETS